MAWLSTLLPWPWMMPPRSRCVSSGVRRVRRSARRSSMADVITAEIVREYLETVCAEMSTVIENTTVATGFNSSHDYSQGVFHYDGQRVNLLARQLSEP